MSASQVYVNFQGRVQGVGFRFTVDAIARKFSVTGYVRNLPDGSVEVIASGDEKEVQNFLRAILESRLKGYIYQHTIDWQEATENFSGFRICY